MRAESERRHGNLRDNRRGTFLLETLIAFAMIAAFAVVALRTQSDATLSGADRIQRYWLAEFLRSKAEEMTARPYAAPSGTQIEGIWASSATEKRVQPDGPNRFDNDIALVEVTLTVWRTDHPAERLTDGFILVRRP